MRRPSDALEERYIEQDSATEHKGRNRPRKRPEASRRHRIFRPARRQKEETQMTQPIALVTSKSDAEVAEDLKKEIADKLIEMCLLADKAKDHGFIVSFSIGQQWNGKFGVAQLILAKHF
jgi:hypothetical protein